MNRIWPLVASLFVSSCTAEDGETGDETGTVMPFTLGPVIPCEAPASAVTYVESGEAWGLEAGPEPDGAHLDGGGVAVHDFDGDGDLDLVLAFAFGDLLYYQREGDGFVRGVLDEGHLGGLMGLGDADGDGDVDLLLAGPLPAVYFNEGDGFQRGPLLAMVDRGLVRQLAPADLDGDGDLDLYAATSSPEEVESRTDFLLWNDGTGNFSVDRSTLPTETEGLHGQAFLAVVFDWEVDGDPDIYIDNDMGPLHGANVMLRNDDGVLRDATDDCSCGIAHMGMGGDAGDYNDDGWPDLYLSATGKPLLLSGLADGSFVDVTLTAGADPVVKHHEMTWGAAWLDYDNNAQPDLLVAQGDLWSDDHTGRCPRGHEIFSKIKFEASINLLAQDGGTFEDMGPALGLATTGSWRGVSAADHNGDGVLDLLVTEVVGRPHLYLSQGCTSNGWVAIEAPAGSRVEVEAGGKVQVDWIHPTSGFGAAGPLEVWFGLGDAQTIDRLRVELPWDGGVYESSGAFEARRRVSL